MGPEVVSIFNCANNETRREDSNKKEMMRKKLMQKKNMVREKMNKNTEIAWKNLQTEDSKLTADTHQESALKQNVCCLCHDHR